MLIIMNDALHFHTDTCVVVYHPYHSAGHLMMIHRISTAQLIIQLILMHFTNVETTRLNHQDNVLRKLCHLRSIPW